MRCSICDATHDGFMSNRPWKSTRKFNTDPDKPWLLVCTDCDDFSDRPNDHVLEDGDIPNIESLWDD